MANAESSAAAAKNGIKANANINGVGDGATHDLPWYDFLSYSPSPYNPMSFILAYSKSGLKNTDQCTWTT